MNTQWLGYLLAGGSLLSFTMAILVTKTASRSIPLNLGFLVATATNVVCAAMAYGVQWLVQPTPLTWNGSALAGFAAAGVLASYLGRWFFYESVVLLGPAKASIFQVSNPLFTALVAWLALGEHLPLSVFVAMFMAIAGLMVISLKPLEARTPPAQTGATPQERSREPMRPRASLRARLRTSMLCLGLRSALADGLGNVLRGAAIRDWNEPILGGLIGAASGLLSKRPANPC